MNKCPYRIMVVNDHGTTKEEYMSCYEWECPLYDNLQERCMKAYKEQVDYIMLGGLKSEDNS